MARAEAVRFSIWDDEVDSERSRTALNGAISLPNSASNRATSFVASSTRAFSSGGSGTSRVEIAGTMAASYGPRWRRAAVREMGTETLGSQGNVSYSTAGQALRAASELLMEYLVIIRYRLTDNNVPACYHTSTGFQMEESAASIGVEKLEEILVLDETLSQPHAVFLAE
jgi:hypothetical protein